MRKITVRYAGKCHKCGAEIPVGAIAVYEKRVGLFCPGCEPTDTEEIRAVRQEAADRHADRLDGWAEKRETRAEATLTSLPEVRRDWAFITQPGRIPLRDRMNRADARASESLQKAKEMRGKAERLRKVQVKGDAEKARQLRREAADRVISKGSRVYDFCFGNGTVVGVYKKSYRIKFDGGYTYARDKSFVRPAE